MAGRFARLAANTAQHAQRARRSARTPRWLTGRAALVSPAARLIQQTLRLDEFEQRMCRALRHLLKTRVAALSEHESRLWKASPLARVRDAAARHAAALLARLRAAGVEHLRRARERLLPLVAPCTQ